MLIFTLRMDRLTPESHNICVMACFLSDSPCSRETAGPTARAIYPRYDDRGP